MKYIIKRTDLEGLYVANPERDTSYTNKRSLARAFNSKKEAQRNCCGNEVIEPYED